MQKRIDYLEKRVAVLQAAILIMALMLVSLFTVAAHSSASTAVTATSLTLVDDVGTPIGHWDGSGIQASALNIVTDSKKSTYLDENGIKTLRLVVTDTTGQERGRWETDSRGNPRLGLEDESKNVRFSLGVTNGWPGMNMAGSAPNTGLTVIVRGAYPQLSLRDPRTAAEFGGTVIDRASGETRSIPVGRLAQYVDGKPVPLGSNVR